MYVRLLTCFLLGHPLLPSKALRCILQLFGNVHFKEENISHLAYSIDIHNARASRHSSSYQTILETNAKS